MSRELWGVSALILASAASASALAQTAQAPESSTSLTEIVVTARKTTENLQKAPASIVAVTGAQLKAARILVPTDLNKVLPSAQLDQEGAVAQTFIRGVGSTTDFPWTSPAVAMTYNGIVIPRYGTLGLMFDLSSVQSIAGPQGTL